MKRFLWGMVLASLLAASPAGYATPILESVTPVASTFTFGTGADFTVPSGTGFGDVTAALWAVDLQIPSPGGSTSGCEAADFAGFVSGRIALIQRGTCLFETKVVNAEAAGAAGVLLFNEGNLGRQDAIGISLGGLAASKPVFFASFGVGDLLRNGVLNGDTGFTVRMKVEPEDIAVPEPGTLALLTLGLAGLAAARRRRG